MFCSLKVGILDRVVVLNYLKKYTCKYVMIHDAARPFISKKLIDKLILS